MFKELFIIFIEYVFLLKELLDKDFLFFNVSLELLVSFLICVENFDIYNKWCKVICFVEFWFVWWLDD